MRFTVFCYLISFVCCFAAFAQQDSLAVKHKGVLNPVDPKTVNPFLPDSVINANRQKALEDSIAFAWLIPDSTRASQWRESVFKTDLNQLLLQPNPQSKQRSLALTGNARYARTSWILAVVIGLLLYTGLLNIFLSSDIKNVLQSFYNKNALSQAGKEGGPINSWAFIGLFLLFCLTLGLVVFQLTQYFNVVYPVSGFQLFITLSGAIGLLGVIKIVILKFIGFVFEIGSVISEYIAVLNLTYFNMAFVFLGVAICFSLLATQFIPLLLIFTLGLISAIFVWQYMRNSLTIISDFRFEKFYLIIYLCALEICPVLILVKALNI